MHTKSNYFLLIFICILFIIRPASVLAARQGILTQGFQMTGLRDFNFGTVYPPYSYNLRQTSRVCIYNGSSKTYSITATGLNDRGAIYFLKNGDNEIRYRVRWDGPIGSFRTLNAGQEYNFVGAHQTLLCAGVPSSQKARLRIIIRSAWIDGTPLPGKYTDTLTLRHEASIGTVQIQLTIP